jgi:serine O-acetyltransferase
MTADAASVWPLLQRDAAAAGRGQRFGADLASPVVNANSFRDALTDVLAARLEGGNLSFDMLRRLIAEAFSDAGLLDAAAGDLIAAQQRVAPAGAPALEPFLFFKGFHALQTYRAAHALWAKGERLAASALQSRMADAFGVDIHPAARIGRRVIIDHGVGVVIGETAVVEDDVAMWHGVCLGSTFSEPGDRHPKIRRGAILGAGAIILGNIEIGTEAVVAAGAVVRENVPAGVTVAGVPARIVSRTTNVPLVRP